MKEFSFFSLRSFGGSMFVRIKTAFALFSSVIVAGFLFSCAAYAGGDGVPEQPNGLVNMVPFVVVIVFFYFLMIRPQQKRQKEVKDMLDALRVGDTVVTSGGVIGKVSAIDNEADTVTVLANEKVELLLYRRFITEVLSGGVRPSGGNAESSLAKDAGKGKDGAKK